MLEIELVIAWASVMVLGKASVTAVVMLVTEMVASVMVLEKASVMLATR